MNKADLTVGQKVTVLHTNFRQKPEEGTVTKIGRTLVTIETGEKYKQSNAFRIDDQCINDNYGHSRFRTVEQHAAESQRQSDLEILKGYGIKFDYNGFPSNEILSLFVQAIENMGPEEK